MAVKKEFDCFQKKDGLTSVIKCPVIFTVQNDCKKMIFLNFTLRTITIVSQAGHNRPITSAANQ